MARFLFALGSILLLAAAGCTQGPATKSTTTTSGSPAVTMLDGESITFVAGHNETARLASATSYRMPTGHDSGEPTIGVSKAGRLFVTSATFTGVGGNPRTDLFRSDDAGLTWKDISPLTAGQKSHPITGDPMLYFDSDTGRLFDIDQIDIACDYISVSDNNGDTWLPPTDACLYPPSDHQTIATGKPPQGLATPLYPKTVYVCMNQVAQTNCERSLDGGLTFQQASPPFQGAQQSGDAPNLPDVCSGLVGHLKSAPDGTLYLPRDQCGRPLVAVSHDGALTWTVTQVSKVASIGSDPAVTVAADGTAYYTWATPNGLLLSTSKDGTTWSPPVQIMAPGLTAANIPAIAAGTGDRVAIAYYATGTPGGYASIQKSQTNADKATWTAYLAIVGNATSAAPTLLTTRLTNSTDVLARGNCGPGRCKGVFDFIDVQVDADGRAWVALTDSCPAKCDAPDATEKDNGGGLGLVGTLATGPSLLDGSPLVAIHPAK